MQSHIRVSIVEDDDRIRTMFINMIENAAGFRCVGGYGDAESALTDIPLKKPDIVLMDINLPGMNGIECVKALKSADEEILAVMLTVYEDTDRIFDSLEAGAVGYLLKSTPSEEILDALRDVKNGGAPMSAQIARKVVKSFHKPSDNSLKLAQLSERELEILTLLASGFMYKEIASELFLSIDTIKTHIRHIYDKLQVRTRTEAVVKFLNK